VPFLVNLVTHPDFLAYKVTTRFIDETPELFFLPRAAGQGDEAADVRGGG